MFDLADAIYSLSNDEKMKYDMGTTGHYFGYKRSGAMFVDDKGTPDQSEFYNISKDEILGIGERGANPSPHPQVVTDRKAQLDEYMRSCHRVITGLVDALGRELGLDPHLLPSLHRIDRPSVCQARVTHAPPVSEDTICLGEHTDFGSVTVLFNQLGGLQALEPNSREWKYVAPKPECAIINLGDAFVKLCGGRLYSAVHRVMGPPGEQARSDRHSVVYFSRPNSDIKLRSLFDPPPRTKEEEDQLMNADAWVANRAKTWNSANYKDKRSYLASRGTEHNVERPKAPTLDKPANEIEAV